MSGQSCSQPTTLCDEVALLANMACAIDDIKNQLPVGERRERLRFVVDEMHAVAGQLDRLYGFGIYAQEAA